MFPASMVKSEKSTGWCGEGWVEEGVVQDQQPAQLCTPAPLLLLVVPWASSEAPDHPYASSLVGNFGDAAWNPICFYSAVTLWLGY